MLLEITISVFAIILLLVTNSYLVFPFLMYLSSFNKRDKNTENYVPSISILIAAYNEEEVIEDRIENIALQDYDFSKLELLVGSDCSSDKTNKILEDMSKKYDWLKIFAFTERRGKAGVLNDLIDSASNSIIVFSDANTVFNKDAIKVLVQHFSNSNIGGICGKLVLSDKSNAKNESIDEVKYWQLETKIKEGEGNLGILIGANGGNFAIRKELATYLPPKTPVTDDLFLSLSVLQKGAKFIYEPNSIAAESVGENIEAELKRKVRFAATNFQTLALTKNLLFNKNLLLSYAYWSHKVIRWIFPILMVVLFSLSVMLYNFGVIFKIVFYLQILFYLLSLLGFFFSKKKIPLLSLPYFFVVSNIALFKGLVKYIKGKHSAVWESTKR